MNAEVPLVFPNGARHALVLRPANERLSVVAVLRRELDHARGQVSVLGDVDEGLLKLHAVLPPGDFRRRPGAPHLAEDFGGKTRRDRRLRPPDLDRRRRHCNASATIEVSKRGSQEELFYTNTTYWRPAPRKASLSSALEIGR